MYIPKHFLETEWEPQEELIRKYPLATVITSGEGGLIANHFPFHLSIDEETGKKYLLAHVAKANHQIPALKSDEEVLVVFKSEDSYITPSYYPTKKENHKVVPTWDFSCVHCYGKARIIDDESWVRKQLDSLSAQQEKSREEPWSVSEAPENYIKIMQKAICGLEIEIQRTECKFKFEQKMKRQDIDGVIAGLENDGKSVVSSYVLKSNQDSS